LPISELKEWAIGIKGPTEKVLELTNGEDLIYENRIGADTMYAVVKDNFSTLAMEKAGIELSPVRASELCVYLTNDSKGGIDDVFN
jgi:ABC-2 type transport system ATP-binding protein